MLQEGRDKQFLVAQVNEILQHLEATSSWQYNVFLKYLKT